ncbi:MAG: acyl-ACP--UDP-N-acetylglucosamine O-acyltransferase [Planctomycetes bacterium]|nr:acyl-ACP--UDP-N-acetylglucosamine O-acyltransferase [Planctomycetota bacterium]
MAIHPTAIVDPSAEIDPSVEIGAYAIVEGDVRIGAGTRIYPHAFVGRYTTIGERCHIHPFAVVGHVPQDLSYDGSMTYTRVGNDTTVREGATVHRAAIPGATTVVGDRCLIMSVAHVGHDCVLGNEVKLANSGLLAGHVRVEDKVFVSGNSAVHQFVRLGELAIIGGGLRVNADVVPFMMHGPDGIVGPNVIGMRRAGYGTEERQEIRLCHRILFRSKHTIHEALHEIERTVQTEPGRKFAAFLRAPSKRGLEGLRLRRR